MRTFGFALAAVLCTIQLAVALPRPDFGISMEVFSADKTDAVALAATSLLSDLWNTDSIDLTSEYVVLSTLETELNTIGTDFAGKVEDLLTAISDLANANSAMTDAFGAVTDGIVGLESYMQSDVTTNFDNLEEELTGNYIIPRLLDAFNELDDTLSILTDAKNEIRVQLEAALEDGEGSVSKVILRENLSPSDTTAFTNAVLQLKADLPLVFYILMKSKDLLKQADEYILETGDASDSAVEYINEGLSVLVDEIDQYYAADAGVVMVLAGIVADATVTNLDFSSVDMSSIPDVEDATVNFATTYESSFESALSNIQGHYTDYKASVPDVSDGYAYFYENDANGHIYDLITVLINFGPYAEYCFNKYREDALVLFEMNARNANECVDIEITRLLKLEEVLIYLAETLVFSVEDLLETVEACSAQASACNDSGIATYLSDLNSVVSMQHLAMMEDIVNAETDAGLARLSACFTAKKYDILYQSILLRTDINSCEITGPYVVDLD